MQAWRCHSLCSLADNLASQSDVLPHFLARLIIKISIELNIIYESFLLVDMAFKVGISKYKTLKDL